MNRNKNEILYQNPFLKITWFTFYTKRFKVGIAFMILFKDRDEGPRGEGCWMHMFYNQTLNTQELKSKSNIWHGRCFLRNCKDTVDLSPIFFYISLWLDIFYQKISLYNIFTYKHILHNKNQKYQLQMKGIFSLENCNLVSND